MKHKHIATGAIFTSLIVVLTSLSYVIPGIELLFVFFLPFFSSYISFIFGIKKSIPFLFATFILATLISYITSLVYVLPALISGISFGVIARKTKKIIDLTFIMGFIEACLFALSMLIISWLFGTKIEEDISSLMNISIQEFNNNVLLLLYIIGTTQAIFTTFIIVNNYEKLNLRKFSYKPGAIILISNILSIIIIIFSKEISVFKLAYLIYFVTLIIQVISSVNIKIKYNWIIYLIQIITFLFISIPVLTIISDKLKLFVYSWFLIPLVVKNYIQVFKFKQ